MKTLRALGRLLYFAVYTSLRISQIMLGNLLWGEDVRRAMRVRQSWARHLLPAIGIRIEMRGKAPNFPCIVMGNHRSYLDPAILVRDVIGYPVSKAEVANWPIVGYGARITGVFFLRRESQNSRKVTLNGIEEKVKSGFPVILFPEGTTHSEPTTRTFRAGGFKLAASAGIPIVPVAIAYRSPDDHWIGNDTFLSHFLRRFGEAHMDVRVHFGEVIQSADADWLLQRTQSWIDSELPLLQESF
jgi:1-acyl-sn-glycerol-3-phosphate acyltransferase